MKTIKICQNPDCGKIINDYKSSKKKYCNDYCRNHSGHIRRKEENKFFTTYCNGQKRNYKILKLYNDCGIYEESLIKLQKFGFDSKYLPEQRVFEDNGNTYVVYTIKDITFSLYESDNIKIFKNNP
jgi:hypothetical protein